MKTQEEKLSFESALLKLQTTVKSLEGGEMTLEQSLQAFEEGVKLTKICQQFYTEAEQKVDLLVKSGNANSSEVSLEPFKS
jgi:exodeoxyribonuclease VII small subunit